jgi:hypothetical protein
LTNKNAAPVEEQQISSPNDTSLSLVDAIRLACYAIGIDHDVAELMVGGTVARYNPKPDSPLRELIQSLEPGAIVRTDFFIHQHGEDGTRRRSKLQAERIAAAIIASLGGEYVTVAENQGSERVMCWLSVDAPHSKYHFDIVYTPEEGA